MARRSAGALSRVIVVIPRGRASLADASGRASFFAALARAASSATRGTARRPERRSRRRARDGTPLVLDERDIQLGQRTIQ